MQAQEGSTAVLTRGTLKHRLLVDLSLHPEPAIDRERWVRAGISPVSCPWHRIGDLVTAGCAKAAFDGYDALTKKAVRRTVITKLGLWAVEELKRKRRIKL